MEDGNQLGKDKGKGGEERRRQVQHHVNGVEIESARKMKYLGVMLDEEGSHEAEVDHK